MKALNKCQKVACDGILHAFLDQGVTGAKLIGEGGTGKTFSVMSIAKPLIDAGMGILFIAPTNKAVKQLEKSAKEYGLPNEFIDFSTAHRALGLAMLPDEENKFAAQVGHGTLDLFDVVICDEGSMLSRIVLQKYLLPRIQANNSKLLIMMDDMQLPPVKESYPSAMDLFQDHTYRLTTVERQQRDSTILTLTGALRTAIDGGKPFAHVEVGGDVEEIKTAEFTQAVVDAFDAETDLDKQRVLAWRNFRVNDINAAIRKKIYGPRAAKFEVGERIVTGAPITNEEGETLLSTDEECVVEAVSESFVHDEKYGRFETLLLALRPLYADTSQVLCHVLATEKEESRMWEKCGEIATRAKKSSGSRYLWAEYHRFKDQFASIKYCYCITVHRSQGSTYETAFVDVRDILANRKPSERKSLLYVAYSRPSKKLIINKKKYVA